MRTAPLLLAHAAQLRRTTVSELCCQLAFFCGATNTALILLQDQCDRDKSGILDKKEFALVIDKAKKHMTAGPARMHDLDLDSDWARIRKVPLKSNHQNMMLDGDMTPEEEVLQQEEGITFKSFESWWKDRAGIVEPDIPVLPEFMVMRISERAHARDSWLGTSWGSLGVQSLAGSLPTRPQLHWRSLGARLRTLIDMKRHWGDFHEM